MAVAGGWWLAAAGGWWPRLDATRDGGSAGGRGNGSGGRGSVKAKTAAALPGAVRTGNDGGKRQIEPKRNSATKREQNSKL